MPSSIDFAELVRTASDAIVACDAAGLVTLWNPAAERIFGFTESEALGQSLDLIIPERQRPRHWHGYHQTMRTGQTRYATDVLRVPALHKDGRTLSIAFTVSLLQSAENRPNAIVAIIRDETARWEQERELRRRLAEAETKINEGAATRSEKVSP